MKKQLMIILVGMLIGTAIAAGTGIVGAPPGGPPAGPPGGDGGGIKSTLPTGFYPYQGYHYSGYVVGINPTNKTFSFYTGRIQNFSPEDPWDKRQTELIETDESIFFRINDQGKEERASFDDLKLSQLVWLKGVELNGKVVLKIQLSRVP